jgi:hypothetical protein
MGAEVLSVRARNAHTSARASAMRLTESVVVRCMYPEQKAEGKIKGRVTGLLSIGKGEGKYGLREGATELRSRHMSESNREKVSYG